MFFEPEVQEADSDVLMKMALVQRGVRCRAPMHGQLLRLILVETLSCWLTLLWGQLTVHGCSG